jgi:hypothetical protein
MMILVWGDFLANSLFLSFALALPVNTGSGQSGSSSSNRNRLPRDRF